MCYNASCNSKDEQVKKIIMKISINKLTHLKTNSKAISATIILLSALVFISIYGTKVLNPTYVDWLLEGGDLSCHYLGWKAYRMSAWHFPIGMADRLAYPYQTSVIFTDSIPLLAVPCKILSPLLPANFQYFGIWGIGSFILQGLFASRIIKKYIDEPLTIILTSILFVYAPVMIWRMYGHTALAGQWILLLGLEPIFNYKNYNAHPKRLYLIVSSMGILSSATHIYFVAMSGMILLGICFMDIAQNRNAKHTGQMAMLYLISVTATIGLLGGFNSGMDSASSGLGYYSMNMNALFNPQGWSIFLQTFPLQTDGQYEGFAYLGFGCILLLFVATIIVLGEENSQDKQKNEAHLYIALSIVAIISYVFALSPTITLGSHLIATLNCPVWMTNLWSIFRSTGRMAWTVDYIIMFCSIIVVGKQLNKRMLLILCVLVLIFQVTDIHTILASKYDYFSKQMTYASPLTRKDFWGQIAKNQRIKHIVYYSGVDQPMMYALTDWALDNDITTNVFYFARAMAKIAENRDRVLSEKPDDTLFIFNQSEISECSQLDLHYYDVDGLILGYIHPIGGYKELSDYDMAAQGAE